MNKHYKAAENKTLRRRYNETKIRRNAMKRLYAAVKRHCHATDKRYKSAKSLKTLSRHYNETETLCTDVERLYAGVKRHCNATDPVLVSPRQIATSGSICAHFHGKRGSDTGVTALLETGVA